MNYDLAKQKFSEGNFQESKLLYESCLDILNKKLDHHRLRNICGDTDLMFIMTITKEYIDCLKKIYTLNISETNPYYVSLISQKEKVKTQMVDKSIVKNDVMNFRYFAFFDTIDWGKHKGQEIISIVRNDPQYILWCIINLFHFNIDHIIFILDNVRRETEYKQALEISLIKDHIRNLELNANYKSKKRNSGSSNSSHIDFGYDTMDEFIFNEGFEGDIDAWNHYNQ